MQWSSRLWLAACWLAGACTATPAPAPEVKAPAEPVVAAVHVEEQHSCGMEGHSCGAEPQPAAAGEASANGLTRIGDHAGVCMLSNRYLGERADVPIQVEGKTYRGCCANCAARLGSVAEARIAKDPVTGHDVDKGTAVLARDANNRVYYFESEATFAKYAAR
jgi:YHS domain-containing protein